MILTGRVARQFIDAQDKRGPVRDNAHFPVADIRVDAERFQFKIGCGSQGTTGGLSGIAQWNPALAQGVMVWTDPDDNLTYVVNGHHRVALARRLGVEYLENVYHVAAPNAMEARAIGALTNIAEGHGTAIDAAKFFRDSGFTAAEVLAKLPPKQKIVADGLALSNLNEILFHRVTMGELAVERGVIIGERLSDGILQNQLVDLIERQSRREHITNDVIAELAEMVAGAPRMTATQATLFGDVEISQSFAVEKASLLAYIKGRLGQDKRIFAVAAQHGEELARGGNVIDRQGSRSISEQSGQLLGLFDIIKHQVGPCANILDAAAMRVGIGENGNIVRGEAYEAIIKALQAVVNGGSREDIGTGAPVPDSVPVNQIAMFAQ